MSGEVRDVQFSSFTIANDATEQPFYTALVPANSITTATRYQMVVNGVMSTRALAPGSLTMRLSLNGVTATIVSDTMVLGASNTRITCNLEAWFKGDGSVGIGGFFAQNASDLFTTSGVRIGSATGSVDGSVDKLLTATLQFGTADPGNSFTRTLAALFVLTG